MPSGLQAWAEHRIACDLAARPASQLMRDPWGATGHYLDTHNDLEIAADAGLAAMAIIPGGKALRGAGYAAKTARTLTREEAAAAKLANWDDPRRVQNGSTIPPHEHTPPPHPHTNTNTEFLELMLNDS
ncbi:hypothetical protein [Actinomyces oris]|uniref:hypothetical protein n=1 Tax=Actinomyces oris TaxID=544580 RepID=UPI000A4D7C98|nr:hypothetical protein [Actinomyces oris]